MSDVRTEREGSAHPSAGDGAAAGAFGDTFGGEQLPADLPESPFGILKSWFDDAAERRDQPNPNAMTLATVDPDGRPSARIVLCKRLDPERGLIVFYTNRTSRKGRALEHAPARAALVMHWDHADRQVRVEGPVTRSPEPESDAYFASRRWEKRLGAWASDQSRPIESREALLAQLAERALALGIDLSSVVDSPEASHVADVDIPRPPHWGGYRVWAERVELWCGGTGRVHDRAEWVRGLRKAEADGAPGFEPAGPWSSTRVQP